MNCEELHTALDDYLDGALDAGATAAFEAHAAGCDSCGARVQRAQKLGQALRDYPVETPAPGFARRAVERARRRPSSQFAGKLVAASFVATLLLSIATVILTGLNVEAPRTQLAAGLPVVTMEVLEPRTVNLVFNSTEPLDNVVLLMTLPRGVELDGYPAQTQIEWRASLAAGKNVLPLSLIARNPGSGQLVAELGQGELRKVFRVYLDVSS